VAQAPKVAAKKIPLQFPIVWANETISELTVQRPTAAQLWAFPLPTSTGASMPMGAILEVAAKCCGLPDEAIKLLDGVDALALATHVGELLGSSLPTGT
jgi:hypothetical protein